MGALVLATLTALVSGCATTRALYVPSADSKAASTDESRLQTTFRIPSEAPKGTVRVTSAGVVELKPENGQGEPFNALHVQLTVSNQDSDFPWTLDPKAQSLALPNVPEQLQPVMVKPDEAQASQPIKRGEIRTVDLFYRLPPQKPSTSENPAFELHWKVNTGERLATNTVTFNRVLIDSGTVYPPYYYPYYYPNYGGYYYHPYPYYNYGVGGTWIVPPPVTTAPGPVPSKPVIIGH